MEPPGRMFQDQNFDVHGLEHCKIERLIGLVSQDRPEDRPIVVNLKVEGVSWQRFFLDAGIAFWEDWGKLIDEEEDEDTFFVDYGDRFALQGERISSIQCRNSCIMLILQSHREIRLIGVDVSDLNAESQIVCVDH
jgi:hypothetical protein